MKTIKLLEENPCDLGDRQICLRTQKPLAIGKNYKLLFIKINSFCFLKDTIMEKRR